MPEVDVIARALTKAKFKVKQDDAGYKVSPKELDLYFLHDYSSEIEVWTKDNIQFSVDLPDDILQFVEDPDSLPLAGDIAQAALIRFLVVSDENPGPAEEFDVFVDVTVSGTETLKVPVRFRAQAASDPRVRPR